MQSIRKTGGRTATAIVLVVSSAILGWGGRVQAQSVEELRHLSLEQLADLEITSVSRRPEPVSEAAASVFVITSEDIRRSGAVSLPEVLRVAPE